MSFDSVAYSISIFFYQIFILDSAIYVLVLLILLGLDLSPVRLALNFKSNLKYDFFMSKYSQLLCAAGVVYLPSCFPIFQLL